MKRKYLLASLALGFSVSILNANEPQVTKESDELEKVEEVVSNLRAWIENLNDEQVRLEKEIKDLNEEILNIESTIESIKKSDIDIKEKMIKKYELRLKSTRTTLKEKEAQVVKNLEALKLVQKETDGEFNYEPKKMKDKIRGQIDTLLNERKLDGIEPDRRVVLDKEIDKLRNRYSRIREGRSIYSLGLINAEHESVWGYSMFEPSARVYFDTGRDDDGEIDLFDDGKMAVNVSVAKFYHEARYDNFAVGANIQLGLAASNGESSTDAPVVTVGAGVELKVYNGEGASPLVLELGYMKGYSSEESFSGGDRDDGAMYVGINFSDIKSLLAE